MQGPKDVFRLHMGFVEDCYLQYVFDPSKICLVSRVILRASAFNRPIALWRAIKNNKAVF